MSRTSSSAGCAEPAAADGVRDLRLAEVDQVMAPLDPHEQIHMDAPLRPLRERAFRCRRKPIRKADGYLDRPLDRLTLVRRANAERPHLDRLRRVIVPSDRHG